MFKENVSFIRYVARFFLQILNERLNNWLFCSFYQFPLPKGSSVIPVHWKVVLGAWLHGIRITHK